MFVTPDKTWMTASSAAARTKEMRRGGRRGEQKKGEKERDKNNKRKRRRTGRKERVEEGAGVHNPPICSFIYLSVRPAEWSHSCHNQNTSLMEQLTDCIGRGDKPLHQNSHFRLSGGFQRSSGTS